MLERLTMMAVVIILVLLSWLSKQLVDRDEQMRETVFQLRKRVDAMERGHKIVDGVETCTNSKCPICNQ
jgi:hypothetical protein